MWLYEAHYRTSSSLRVAWLCCLIMLCLEKIILAYRLSSTDRNYIFFPNKLYQKLVDFVNFFNIDQINCMKFWNEQFLETIFRNSEKITISGTKIKICEYEKELVKKSCYRSKIIYAKQKLKCDKLSRNTDSRKHEENFLVLTD